MSTTATIDRPSLIARVARQREAWVFAILVLTAVVVGLMQPSFLSTKNALDIMADAAPALIIACGLTLVVVTGEIDISVGSTIGLAAATMGLLCYGEHPVAPPLIGAVAAVGVGLAVGVVNGLLVTLGGVPSIIVTLGMLTMLRGVTKLVMHGNSIDGRPESLRALATGSLLGVPISIWIAAVVVALAITMVRRTPLGMRIYAVGSNARAAPLAGISVARTKFFTFALTGLLAGVATVLLAPRNAIIQPNAGEGLELLIVTCVVVGGTSISGGRGTILGTTIAVMLLGMVPTVLTYVGAPAERRMVIEGGFILVAVLADQLVNRNRAGGRA